MEEKLGGSLGGGIARKQDSDVNLHIFGFNKMDYCFFALKGYKIKGFGRELKQCLVLFGVLPKWGHQFGPVGGACDS